MWPQGLNCIKLHPLILQYKEHESKNISEHLAELGGKWMRKDKSVLPRRKPSSLLIVKRHVANLSTIII